MSDEITVVEISGREADILVNEESHVLQDFPAFRDGFGDEFLDNRNRFSARSKDKRTYYVISSRGKREALIGMHFRNSSVAEIGGMGRLFKKLKEDTATMEAGVIFERFLTKSLSPMASEQLGHSWLPKEVLRHLSHSKRNVVAGMGSIQRKSGRTPSKGVTGWPKQI